MDAELSQPLALVDGGLEVLACNDTSEETTGESITRFGLVGLTKTIVKLHLPGSVGVVDLLLADGVNGVLSSLGALDSDGRVSALGEDNNALLL